MVGNKGKGSRSKPKALRTGPAEPEPLKISLDNSADVALDGEGGNTDISNGTEILLDEMINDVISGYLVSDVFEENDQIALEDNNHEKNVVTEIKGDRTEDVCTQGGTIDNVEAASDGGHTTTILSVEDFEERIDMDNPQEDFTIADEREVIMGDASANHEGTASDHGLMENMTDSWENHKEPSKPDADEQVGTRKVSRPKRKVIKKKLVKRKLVRKTAVPQGPQPSDENNASTEACEVEVDGHKNIEEKASDVNFASDEACKADYNERVTSDEACKPVNSERVTSDEVCKPDNSERVTSDKACKTDTNENVTPDEACKTDNNERVTSDEACKADNKERVSNEKEAEVKPSVKVNNKRKIIRKKKAPQGQSGIATIKDTQKPQSGNDESGSGEHFAINEPHVKKDKMEKSEDKASPLKSKEKKIAKKGSQDVVSKDIKKPKEGKSLKKVESMGMIFMCNSETKKECFRYKVLGLPASKKDMVLKIYKGMRLFLFDVDMRMMYGIYKAAGPGGYNVEPRAFKSQFPSQVRFTILEDCVPLAEERFRKVLKDNYYSKKKFNFQLNHEQVKNLCKLFHETSKKAESSKAASKIRRAPAGPSSSVPWLDNKRRRADDSRRVAPLERERSRRRVHEEVRHAPVVIADRYHERPPYERETYVPSVAPPVPNYEPLPPPRSPSRSGIYSFDRLLGVDPYRTETVIDSRDLAPYRRETVVDSRDLAPYRRETVVDSRDLAPYRRETVVDSRDLVPLQEPRLPIERTHYDSYVPYREPPPVYNGQAYSSATRGEPYDYSASDRQYGAEYYRSADYQAPPPLYRRY